MHVIVGFLLFALANCAVPNAYTKYLQKHDVESIINKELVSKIEKMKNEIALDNQNNTQYLKDVMSIKNFQIQDFIRLQATRVINDLKSILIQQSIMFEEMFQKLTEVSVSLRQECVFNEPIDKKEIINLWKQKKLKMLMDPQTKIDTDDATEKEIEMTTESTTMRRKLPTLDPRFHSQMKALFS
jgi:hypothetical protein